MSRVSAASRPAARIGAKSSGAWIVIRLASLPPSMVLALHPSQSGNMRIREAGRKINHWHRWS
jgi:hypothetical protein